MAKQIQEILIDDLDGGEANETVGFAIDGISYEIDLSEGNAKKLRDALSPFVQSARKSGSGVARRRGGRGSSRQMTREQSSEIRAWAKSRGLNVSERGRIAKTIVDEYERAH
ncbi:Lsr2 family protein [Nonomuraea sp. NPDC050310]|uniref:histone-like nucleoid-structuring protein Lsr2 n=1 Tax=unclassified Nonomuraea TaxID=2593643 RepID=UPI003407C3F2